MTQKRPKAPYWHAKARTQRDRYAQWLAFHIILVAVGVPLGYMIYQLTHP